MQEQTRRVYGGPGFSKSGHPAPCWGDAEQAREVVRVTREKLLSWRPDVVFTGHDVHTDGVKFITELVRETEESLDAKK